MKNNRLHELLGKYVGVPPLTKNGHKWWMVVLRVDEDFDALFVKGASCAGRARWVLASECTGQNETVNAILAGGHHAP